MTAMAETPYEKFSTDKNFTNVSNIHWEQVDNIQEVCDGIRIKQGLPRYGYKLEACSVWSRSFFFVNTCTIFTARKVNMWTVGHEIRHCFQGDFHK